MALARCTSTVACPDDVSAAHVSPTLPIASTIHGTTC